MYTVYIYFTIVTSFNGYILGLWVDHTSGGFKSNLHISIFPN